jgi:hypothetical protein
VKVRAHLALTAAVILPPVVIRSGAGPDILLRVDGDPGVVEIAAR